MIDIVAYSDKEILREAHKLASAYKLKKTIRYGATRDLSIHSESVAEHVFGLIFLAQYFLLHEPVAQELDVTKLHRILLFHDFGEIKNGDVVTYYKNEVDEQKERVAAREVFAMLPSSLQELGYADWRAYEEQLSLEAHFAHALDRLEPQFELLDPVNSLTVKRLKVTSQMNTENKFKAVKNFPVMKRFMEVMSKDMEERGIFFV